MARLPLHRWRYSTRLLFSGCDQATYQQDLVIHRTAGQDHEETSGGLKIWHIFIGPKCRPDYGDLRFTDRYGRELAYYLWPDYDAESARFTVRLEGADAAGELLVWYGNPSAATTSNRDAVIPIYFDFDDGSLTGWVRQNQYSSPGFTLIDSAGRGKVLKAGPTSLTAGLYYRELEYSGGGLLCFSANCPTVGIGHHQEGMEAIAVATYQGETLLMTHVAAFSNKVQDNSAAGTLYESYNTFKYAPDSKHTFIHLNSLGFGNWVTHSIPFSDNGANKIRIIFKHCDGSGNGANACWDDIHIRAYSATPPSLLRTSRGANPSYAGLARLTGSVAADDEVIRFSGVGSILVVGDARETIAGAGSFAIETSVRSPIPIVGAAEVATSLRLVPTPATITGAGDATSPLTCLTTPLDIEAGEGSAYVAPTPVQFDLTKYRFSSLTISRSAQDALWQCEGRIVGLDAPLAYKQFEVRVPDHNGVLRTLFVGFVPGRDYVRAVTADESIIQGYDAGFYLTRQYLPNGDLTYPRVFGWGPARLLHYFLGEESVSVYSRSRWEQITGIMPYRLENPPSYYEWPYSSRIDWVFQPKTTKAQAAQEICEKSGLVFLVKWRKIHGAWTPCAYLVPEEDIDHPTRGLDLPDPVTFTHPDPHVMDGVRVTMRSDEKYNRIEVRSASPSGAWFHAVRETPALQSGDELPIEYLEERSDLPINADHGGWCNARANELYAYYTKYAYTYTLTLINRVDLELYQRCRFYGFDSIPSGEMMRIVAITYNVLPTHTKVEITVTPDSRLSDLRRLQRSQAADSVSEVQTISQSQIDRVAMGEVGTVVGVEGNEAIVELERKADSSVRGRIV